MNAPDEDELSPDQYAILMALVDAPVAFSPAADLAEAAALPSDRATLAIDHLASSGWLDSWLLESTRDPAFTLTPYAASRLGVTLTGGEDNAESLHWSDSAATVRNLRRPPRNQTPSPGAEILARIPDPAPDPTRIVCALDYLQHLLDQIWPSKAKRARVAWERLPNPTVLVGMNNPAYLPADDFARPNPDMGRTGAKYPQNLQKDRACPGCAGQPLKPYEVCPRCSRWGLDSLFSRLLREGANPRVA